jgi:ligand-binding sensor protein
MEPVCRPAPPELPEGTPEPARHASLDVPPAPTDALSGSADFTFGDILDLDEMQRIQDAFSAATGVASIITAPGGHPLTRPSNFSRLCQDVIRKTERSLANCMRSDAVLGRPNPDGPIMQPCLSCGLWEGGASIYAGDRHIANWLIGQVRNETQDDAVMLTYARSIGADEDVFREALAEVTRMLSDVGFQVQEAGDGAAAELRPDALLATVEGVAGTDAELARELRALVDEFEFARIIDRVDAHA